MNTKYNVIKYNNIGSAIIFKVGDALLGNAQISEYDFVLYDALFNLKQNHGSIDYLKNYLKSFSNLNRKIRLICWHFSYNTESSAMYRYLAVKFKDKK